MARRGGGPPDDDFEAREALKIAREAAVADFFETLPAESFTPEEEDLRAAILNALQETGRVRLSIVAQRPEVRSAKAALRLPQGATLTTWIQQRAGEELILQSHPSTGEKTVGIAGTESGLEDPVDALEDFYASLPDDSLTAEELNVRDVLVSLLKRMGGKVKMSVLTRGEEANQLRQARAGLLPKGAPFMGWLERRLASEVRVEPDPFGGHTAELIRDVPLRPAKGSARGKGASKGKGPGKVDEDPLQAEADQLAREQAKAEREQRVAEFFDNLPDDRLLDEEAGLREALLIALEEQLRASRGSAVRLSRICQGDRVRREKARILPDSVSVASWIEARIGGEVLLSKDREGQVMAEMAGGVEPSARQPEALPPPETFVKRPVGARMAVPAAVGGRAPAVQERPWSTAGAADQVVPREERDARVAEYFEGRPLLPLERKMINLFVEAVAQKEGEASRLSDFLNFGTELSALWKQAKAQWRSENVDVPFSLWVEVRMQAEVKVTREPYVQLSKPEMERRGLMRTKRPAPPAEAASANTTPLMKVPRIAGKGGSTYSGAASAPRPSVWR